MKKKIPTLKTDKDAEAFVAESDLTEYDLRGATPARFEFEKKEARVNMRLPQSLLDAVKQVRQADGAVERAGYLECRAYPGYVRYHSTAKAITDSAGAICIDRRMRFENIKPCGKARTCTFHVVNARVHQLSSLIGIGRNLAIPVQIQRQAGVAGFGQHAGTPLDVFVTTPPFMCDQNTGPRALLLYIPGQVAFHLNTVSGVADYFCMNIRHRRLFTLSPTIPDHYNAPARTLKRQVKTKTVTAPDQRRQARELVIYKGLDALLSCLLTVNFDYQKIVEMININI